MARRRRSALVRRIAGRIDMRETANLAKTRRDNPNDSTKIETVPIADITVATRSGLSAIASRLLDNVAFWVNEGGAGGDYSMKALRTLVVEDDA
jgi:hypothetical protein